MSEIGLNEYLKSVDEADERNYELTCEVCGNEFESDEQDKYCSFECRVWAKAQGTKWQDEVNFICDDILRVGQDKQDEYRKVLERILGNIVDIESAVVKRSERLIDLIKKAQTPKGNCVVDWLMKEYENSKIN